MVLMHAPCVQIPPLGKGSMYLRPLLLGTGPTLGLAPSPEITFVVFSAAVGSYFAGGQLTPIDLKVETKYHRAAPLGVGAAKCAGAQPLARMHARAQRQAHPAGVVWRLHTFVDGDCAVAACVSPSAHGTLACIVRTYTQALTSGGQWPGHQPRSHLACTVRTASD